MNIYKRGKRYSNNSRARRLISSIANFVLDCDNDTFYSFASELRSILDAVESSDNEALAYLHFYR